MTHPLRGAVAIAGIGATPNYRHGTSPDPERKLLLKAIVEACDDAGFDPPDVDGFCSYFIDNYNGTSLMHELGTKELRWSTMVTGGGGGGIPGAIGVAAAAIISGQADAVIVFRALAERESGRFNTEVEKGHRNPHYSAHGVWIPAQMVGLRTQRMIEKLGIPKATLDAFSLVDYYHARNNPRAMAYGNQVDAVAIESSRWVVEPYRLFHCSRETDGAAALLVVSAERARSLRKAPVYLLGCVQGTERFGGETWDNNSDQEYGLAGFSTMARRLWEQTGMGPKDVDVAQVYENFSGPGVAALIEHGFCSIEEASEFFTFENMIAPCGKLPINTDGGCLAEGFVHGIGVALEAVRQLRGESSNQVPGAKVCLVTGGPASTFSSSALFGTADTR
jgi:acetyl-CoA acetyltransferase